jgi:hypothetical protein
VGLFSSLLVLIEKVSSNNKNTCPYSQSECQHLLRHLAISTRNLPAPTIGRNASGPMTCAPTRTLPSKRIHSPSHLNDFVAFYNAENRDERQESERFHSFGYDDLLERDKVSLDLFWLRSLYCLGVTAALGTNLTALPWSHWMTCVFVTQTRYCLRLMSVRLLFVLVVAPMTTAELF